jgi:hypothetical protein
MEEKGHQNSGRGKVDEQADGKWRDDIGQIPKRVCDEGAKQQ